MLSKNEYLLAPGKHLASSPVVGSRAHELDLIKQNSHIFEAFNEFIYSSNNKQLIHLIPVELKEKADCIARELFENYIEKYKPWGFTVENIVEWNTKIGLDCSFINNDNEWFCCAAITPSTDLKKHDFFSESQTFYMPKFINAFHELMHVEETIKGIAPYEDRKKTKIVEVLTVTRTLILIDEVYKRVHGIPLNVEVDYCYDLKFFNERYINQGKFANFYRQLEKNFTNLAEAMVSEESLKFLNYLPNDKYVDTYIFYSPHSFYRIPEYKKAMKILGVNNILTEKNRTIIEENLPNAMGVSFALSILQSAECLNDTNVDLILRNVEEAGSIAAVIKTLNKQNAWLPDNIQTFSINIFRAGYFLRVLENTEMYSRVTGNNLINRENFSLIARLDLDCEEDISTGLILLASNSQLNANSFNQLLGEILIKVSAYSNNHYGFFHNNPYPASGNQNENERLLETTDSIDDSSCCPCVIV